MAELGTSSLLPLIELEQRPLDPALAARVRTLRQMVQFRQAQLLREGGWTLLGQHRLSRAEALVGPVRAYPGHRYDCSGVPTGQPG